MKIFVLIFAISTPSFAATEVTLRELVAYAAAQSNRAKMISAQKINMHTTLMRIESLQASKVTGKLSHLNNRHESAGGMFSPEKIDATSIKAGYQKLLSSGTVLGTDIEHKLNDNKYPASSSAISVTPDGKYTETTSSVFLRQKLLANGFGAATDSSVKSAKASSQAIEQEVDSQMEDYIHSLIERFFSVWLIQTNHKASLDRLKRQQRLLKVTEINRRRGTAEESDVLQLKSAVIQSEQLVADIESQLSNLWRGLVISLNLPETYLAMDITTVTLTADDRLTEMMSQCKSGKSKATKAEKSLALNLDASQEQLNALKSKSQPDLYVEARLSANGIDDSSGKSISESLSFDHPQWSFAVGIDWPIGFEAEKADYLDTLSRQTKLNASLDQLKLDNKVARINACATLERNTEKAKAYTKTLKMQKRRNDLEETRFELGQAPLINVIQSGNDITTAEVNLQSSKVDLEISAWEIVKANGLLIDYIRSAVNTIARKGAP